MVDMIFPVDTSKKTQDPLANISNTIHNHDFRVEEVSIYLFKYLN